MSKTLNDFLEEIITNQNNILTKLNLIESKLVDKQKQNNEVVEDLLNMPVDNIGDIIKINNLVVGPPPEEGPKPNNTLKPIKFPRNGGSVGFMKHE